MENVEKHESYAQLSFSRTQGNPGALYGSSIRHQNSIVMELHESEKWGLHRTRHFAKRLLARVEMSATQFAELITSMNTSGKPVTLRYFNGKSMAPCPEVNQRALFEAEFEQKMKDVAGLVSGTIQKAKKIIAAKSVKAADRIELLRHLERIKTELTSNMPFVQSSFNETMDKTVLEAKGEVEAFVTHKVMELGRAALRDQVGVDLIEYFPEKEAIDVDGNDGTPTE